MLIDELRDRYGASLTKTCALFRTSRSLYKYQPVARDSSALLMRIKEIANTRVHYGCPRILAMLKADYEGHSSECYYQDLADLKKLEKPLIAATVKTILGRNVVFLRVMSGAPDGQKILDRINTR